MIQIIGVVASIVLPLWNIPLIVRVVQRRSSADISRWWSTGVWVCLAVLVPSGLTSSDIVWKIFSLSNFAIFSLVAAVVWRYRNGE
ncbi:hypothetical protein ACFL38_02985 [Candidatus Omnitrophota bacterium]